MARLDARVKVLVTLAFLVTVASFHPHDLGRPLPLLLFLAVCLELGEVPLGVLLTRVAVASPFALLIGIWNPLFDTRPLAALGPITVTAGWLSFLSIVERFVLGLTGVVLLVATTGFDQVCCALGRLGVPRVLVTQLVLLYRYAFVLGEEAMRMLRAHALRSPARPRPTWRTARHLLGQLLMRSIRRAERVYVAMLCRGYDGELRRPGRARMARFDWAFLLGWSGFFVLVRAFDWPDIIGRLIL